MSAREKARSGRTRSAGSVVLSDILPRLNRGARLSSRRFTTPSDMVPHTARHGFAWSHNGIMIPSLPDPLRFLSVTTIIGGAGVSVSDVLHTPPPPGGPRNRATAQISTAASAPGFWAEYAIDRDCDLAADGSQWRFGKDLLIEGTYPDFHLVAETPRLTVDLQVTCTDVVSWFVHTPIYRHLSLLARHQGTITTRDAIYEVSGTCTFEHALAISGHTLLNRLLPRALYLPLDFFTYHVLDLGALGQLLFVATESEGHEVLNSVYLRTFDGRSIAVDSGVTFQVLDYQDAGAVTPDGAAMALPRRFQLSSRPGSALPVDIEGTVATPFNWGLGNGYVGGYSFVGSVDGHDVSGDGGYIEYIDRRSR